MQIPAYWAEARVQRRAGRRQITVRRFGWSDVDAAAAQAHAQERAEAALARIAGGEKLVRQEAKQAYNGADGLPIREQIVGHAGAAVLTRNSYGAVCLNTPDVLFADVDFALPPASGRVWRVALWLALVVVVGLLFVAPAGPWRSYALAAGLGVIVLVHAVAAVLRRLPALAKGGAANLALARVHRFARAHPDWRLRIYRTPAGLRLLATHRRFAPDEPAVAEFFAAVGTDPMYARMCRNQQCFRARVSAKPWRIGIAGHLRPRPGVWPVAAERLPERERWLRDYDERARGFAACRFVEEIGTAAVDPDVETVRQLHDDLCRAETDLPLA